MTKGDAEGILEFVKALPEIVHTLVVHCEAGFSRSAGVVKALKELYGYEAEDARLVQANPSVVKTVMEAAEGANAKPKRAKKH